MQLAEVHLNVVHLTTEHLITIHLTAVHMTAVYMNTYQGPFKYYVIRLGGVGVLNQNDDNDDTFRGLRYRNQMLT